MVLAHKPEFDRDVIVYNPKYAETAERCDRDLSEVASHVGKTVMSIETTPGGVRPNAELLGSALLAGDRVWVVGGEGTFRTVAGAMLSPELADIAGEVCVGSLAGGYACDIRRATHRRQHRRPADIAANSVVVAAHALTCTIDNGEPHLAISYIGVGKTAQGAGKINQPEYHHGSRVFNNLRVGLGGLVSGHEFAIMGPDGRSHALSELSFVKGRVMSIVGVTPVEHWDEHYLAIAAAPGVVASTDLAVRLMSGHVQGHEMSNPYSFTTLSQTGIHFDGETPTHLEAGTRITVGLAGQPYNLLTTCLEASDR